jgi:Arc/MetJ-type ribon-helix-helix transcriptional regulator
MTIHLPEDLERYVHATVLSGRFASEQDAITEAVRLLRQFDPKSNLQNPDTSIPPVPAWQRLLNIMGDVPEDVFERMPTDGAEQHDHYIYGTPKRPPS